MPKSSFVALGVAGLLVFSTAWFASLDQKNVPKEEIIVSQTGLHWHAKLHITKGGEVVEIPTGIGLGATHNPLHTHEGEPNVIHMEFEDRVTTNDLMLGAFFAVWQRDIRSFGQNVGMKVNGVENIQYEQYVMQDGDTIELSYD